MGWQDDQIVDQAAAPGTLVSGSPAPWEGDAVVEPREARTAASLLDAVQAGYQGSATGLALRGRLPDVVLDQQHAKWYEKAAAAGAQMVSELPEMAIGGALGGAVGTAGGGAVGSAVPVVGTAAGAVVGGLVGTGAGAFAVPAAIRESLMQAYAGGEVTSSADFLNRAAIVLKTTGKEAAIGGLTFGVGSAAARVTGKILAPAIGDSITVGTARNAIGAAQTGGELGTMVVAPAALEGRLPEKEDFLNAAIVLAGAKASVHVAGKVATIYTRTGRTPTQVVTDAKADPVLADEIRSGSDPLPAAYAPLAAAETAIEAVPGRRAEQFADQPFAEIPQQPGTPKVKFHVNYDRIASSDDAKAALARLSELYRPEVEAQTRGVVGWDQTAREALADTLGRDAGTLEIGGREPGAKINAAELYARKQLLDGAAERLVRMSREVAAKGEENLTPQEKVGYYAEIERVSMLNAEMVGAAAEAGRALQILKHSARDRQFADRIDEILGQYGKKGSITEIARAIGDARDPTQALKSAEAFTKTGTMAKALEIWKASIFSGPTTHIANIFGNTIVAPLRLVERMVASGVGKLLPGDEHVQFSESAAVVVGMRAGIKDALIAAGEALRTGGPEKVEHPGAIPGRVGYIVQTPFRLLAAGDALFRITAERGEMHAQATRLAIADGFAVGTREFNQRVVSYVQNPTAAMLEAAERAAREATFQERLGPALASISHAAAGTPLGFIVPAVRTPVNLFSWAVQRIPGVNLLSSRWREDFAAGGARRDTAISRVLVGGLIIGLMFELADQQIITGGGLFTKDQNRAKRAAGWQPYSVRIGDTYYSYKRLEPVAKLIGLAADLWELYHEGGEDKKSNVAIMGALAVGNFTISQNFLSGLANTMNALVDPARFGERLVQQYAASLVPKIIGQPAAEMDDYQREVDSILGAIKSQVPIWREQLRPQRDAFGAPVQHQNAAPFVPIAVTETTLDKVRTEAARLGVSIAPTPKSIHLPSGPDRKLGRVDLTPEQRDLYAKTAGDTAMQALVPIVNGESWSLMPDLMQKRVFELVFTTAHAFARAQALTPEQRGAEVVRIKEELARQLGGEAAR